MNSIAGGIRDGGLPDDPKDFQSQRRRLIREIGDKCSFEAIKPESKNPRGQLGEFIRLMYQADPNVGYAQEVEIAKTMLSRILKGSLRLTMMRYVGEDLNLGEHTVKKGDVVGINSSRQTRAYRNDWFHSVLYATETFSMDDLTKGIMPKSMPERFKSFEEIEALQEGKIGRGEGTGFLFLAYVDRNLLGGGLSQHLLKRVLRDYRDELNLMYVFTYGRLPRISADAGIAEKYAKEGKMDAQTLNRYIADAMGGQTRDWGLQLHMKAGANIVCGLPDSTKDPESLNSGYLAIYDLYDMGSKGLI